MGVWIETASYLQYHLQPGVTPFVGVWIETFLPEPIMELIRVTPFVGVWIETIIYLLIPGDILSHPSWVCGLKPPGVGG